MYLLGSLKYKNNKSGFTLFELLISMAIIGIVTAIVVLRYGAFYSSVLLKSQAYELALDIREAQVFAVSTRLQFSEYREEYGIYLDTSLPNTYQLFLDNGTSEPAAYNEDEEIGNTFVIDSRFRISGICVNDCSQTVSNLSLSFKRPNFDTIAAYRNESGVAVQVNNARIEIQSVVDEEAIMAVEVTATGQISVKNDAI